jgi:hypothetical protein
VKLLMIVVDEAKKEELEVVLEEAGVVGYTEIPRTVGMGVTGPRLGSRAFPRTSAVIFTILTPEALDGLRAKIRSFCAHCGERLKMVAWDVEEVEI